VGLVAVFSILAGLTYGAWTDGASIGMVGLGFFTFIALLFGALYRLDQRQKVAPAI
jgi:hypothetical protein